MKIAFAGKGGSGKTTLWSLFTRYLAEQELPVVAIDADGPGEYVVVDCTAGADSFASGLFTRFDLDARPKDWQTYARHAAEFHLKNARAWASAATGQDLTTQVDPDFTLGPHAPRQPLAYPERQSARCRELPT